LDFGSVSLSMTIIGPPHFGKPKITCGFAACYVLFCLRRRAEQMKAKR